MAKNFHEIVDDWSNKTPRRPLIARAAAWGALALTLSLATNSHAQSAVRVQQVSEQSIQRHERVTGSLRAHRSSKLAALEDGQITEFKVREAELVDQGQVIAQLDTRRLSAEIKEVEAQLAVAKASKAQRQAELTDASQEASAMRAVAKSLAVSKRRLQRAVAAEAVAKARLGAAQKSIEALQSRIQRLRVRLADATLRAPFKARVIARHTELGQWVRAGDPIVSLISTEALEAWLDVPERFRHLVGHSSQNLTVTLSATGQSQTTKGLRVIPQVDRRARTFRVIAELQSSSGALSAGMSVEAWLPIGHKAPRLLVPKDAVLRRSGLTYVFRVRNLKGQPTAERVIVKALFQTSNAVAISSDTLKARDEVVTEGNERLLNGMTVALLKRTETTPRSPQLASKP